MGGFDSIDVFKSLKNSGVNILCVIVGGAVGTGRAAAFERATAGADGDAAGT